MTLAVTVLLFGVIGACLGSFAATAGLRMARGEQSLLGRSHCDGCGARLNFAMTTPFLGYLQARGACVSCGATIDLTHLAGELAGVFVVLTAVMVTPWTAAMLVAAIGLTLLCASVADFKVRRLPDGLTLAVAGLGLALDALTQGPTPLTGVIVAAIGFVLLEGLRRGYARLRGETGLGFGDVKLVCALALWCGTATSWVLVIAASGGLLAARIWPPRDGRLAFGPFIAAAGFAVGAAREVGPWR